MDSLYEKLEDQNASAPAGSLRGLLLAVAAKPVAEVGLHVGHAVVVERLFLVGVEVRLSVLAKGLGWVG